MDNKTKNMIEIALLHIGLTRDMFAFVDEPSFQNLEIFVTDRRGGDGVIHISDFIEIDTENDNHLTIYEQGSDNVERTEENLGLSEAIAIAAGEIAARIVRESIDIESEDWNEAICPMLKQAFEKINMVEGEHFAFIEAEDSGYHDNIEIIASENKVEIGGWIITTPTEATFYVAGATTPVPYKTVPTLSAEEAIQEIVRELVKAELIEGL